MSDEVVLRHCAPTLAGIKTGSLFSYAYSSKEVLGQELREQKIAAADKAMRDRADAALRKWQGTIYRYADAENKAYLKAYGAVSPQDQKEIKDDSVSSFVRIITGHTAYGALTGK